MELAFSLCLRRRETGGELEKREKESGKEVESAEATAQGLIDPFKEIF